MGRGGNDPFYPLSNIDCRKTFFHSKSKPSESASRRNSATSLGVANKLGVETIRNHLHHNQGELDDLLRVERRKRPKHFSWAEAVNESVIQCSSLVPVITSRNRGENIPRTGQQIILQQQELSNDAQNIQMWTVGEQKVP